MDGSTLQMVCFFQNCQCKLTNLSDGTSVFDIGLERPSNSMTGSLKMACFSENYLKSTNFSGGAPVFDTVLRGTSYIMFGATWIVADFPQNCRYTSTNLNGGTPIVDIALRRHSNPTAVSRGIFTRSSQVH